MPTLYRKYRPSVFADVIGQDTITQTIQNEISSDRLAHAYLFSGPRGVGKTTLARLLAKSISCENRKKSTYEPCNECQACTQINNGRHIDIIEIDAASQTGVDNVRENIIENAGIMPTVLKHKIFIIDEVHMLSTSAFNALLKTLEEPPTHVIFILATTELHKLPATVISRCERFIFKKIPFEKMLARLKKICSEEKVKVEKEVLERIVRKSDGGLRDAESLLGQILSLNLKEVSTEDIQMILPLSSTENLINYLQNIIESSPGKSITLINKIVEEGVDLNQFAHDLLEMLRTSLVQSLNADKSLITADYSVEVLKQLQKISSEIGEKRIVQIMDLALKRKAEIKFSPLPQLPLELLAVEISDLLSTTENFGKPSINEKTPVTNSLKELKPNDKPAPEVKKIETPETEKSAISQITDTIKQAISHITTDSTITTPIETVRAKWKEVVDKASVTVPSLNFILASCSICEINGNTLRVSVPYSIHKDRLETAKNKQLLEECLQSIFSEKIRLAFFISEVVVENKDSEVANLAAEFGGEVVN